MSDKLNSSILDGLGTRPLSDFNKLNPNDFKETKIVNEPSDKNDIKIAPLASPEIKVVRSKEYDKSVNEVVKKVVIQAKVQAELSKNEENKLRYNHVVEYALDKGTISEQELNIGFQEKMNAIIEQNNKEAESVLKEVDNAIEMAFAALKNIEDLDPSNFAEVYLVSMKLESILELKLDSKTRGDVQNALKRIGNVIQNIESKVKYNNPIEDGQKTDHKSPFSFLTQLFSLKYTNN